MKGFAIIILLFFINAFSYGQTTNKNAYYTGNEIDIYLNSTDCVNPKKGTAKEYLFIEIHNKTSSEVKVSFNKEIWYDNVCQTCNSTSAEHKLDIKIPANTELKGGCDSENRSLRIFSKMLDIEGVRKLTKYELKNITIERIN